MIRVYKGSRRVSIKAYGKHKQVEDLVDAVRRLRNGDKGARDEIILGHINLAGSIAATYAAQLKRDPQDIMSVAMLGLCDAVDRIALGSCTHGNFGAYINKCVNGRIDEFVSKDHMIKPCGFRERKNEPYKQATGLDRLQYRDQKVDMSLFESSHFTRREREILQLKYEGHTEGEIAWRLEITQQRVSQILAGLKGAVKRWLKS